MEKNNALFASSGSVSLPQWIDSPIFEKIVMDKYEAEFQSKTKDNFEFVNLGWLKRFNWKTRFTIIGSGNRGQLIPESDTDDFVISQLLILSISFVIALSMRNCFGLSFLPVLLSSSIILLGLFAYRVNRVYVQRHQSLIDKAEGERLAHVTRYSTNLHERPYLIVSALRDVKVNLGEQADSVETVLMNEVFKPRQKYRNDIAELRDFRERYLHNISLVERIDRRISELEQLIAVPHPLETVAKKKLQRIRAKISRLGRQINRIRTFGEDLNGALKADKRLAALLDERFDFQGLETLRTARLGTVIDTIDKITLSLGDVQVAVAEFKSIQQVNEKLLKA